MMIMTNKMGWPSEFTRGYQIADALGCKVNSALDSYDETVLAVKCYFDRKCMPELDKLTNFYVDLIDDVHMVTILKRYPMVKAIAVTNLMKTYLTTQVSNEIVVLPEHSCNFEQQKRTRKDVTVVGYVGSGQCFDLDPVKIRDVLKQIGLEFKFLICNSSNVTRKDVCDFYKTIDIQLTYRIPKFAVRNPLYRNSLKIFNAGSFGIPTVGYPEISYRMEAGTYFLPVQDIGDIVNCCYALKNEQDLYKFYSDRVFEWSKQFDILKIVKNYAKLAPTESFNIEENVKKLRIAS